MAAHFKSIKKGIFISTIFWWLFFIKISWAQGPPAPVAPHSKLLLRMNKVAKGFWNEIPEGEGGTLFASFIGTIINALLTLVGVFFLILVIYAGFRWMFARGNEDEVSKAQKIMISSFQGLIIVVAAYAITNLAGYIITQFGVLN